VPDHNEWAGGETCQFRGRAASSAAQHFFSALDVRRAHAALQNSGRPVILFDNDFLSSLAFAYATAEVPGELLAETFSIYDRLLTDGELRLPHAYIYLNVPLHIRKQRAQLRTKPPASLYLQASCSEKMQHVLSCFFNLWNPERLLVLRAESNLADEITRAGRFIRDVFSDRSPDHRSRPTGAFRGLWHLLRSST
jgi:thymidylate kinase